MTELLKHIHERCSHHEELLQESLLCGCFYCLNIYSPKVIKDWIDDGQTALCPFCNIDSVIPNNENLHGLMFNNILKRLNEVFFSELEEERDLESYLSKPECIQKTLILSAPRSNCPIEVQKEISKLWKDMGLQWNSYFYWNSIIQGVVGKYPTILAYLNARGVDSCLIYWWE